MFLCTTLRKLGSDSNSDWHSYLLDVRRMPLTPPKVERATKTGMMKANLPYRRSAKVWKRMENESTWMEFKCYPYLCLQLHQKPRTFLYLTTATASDPRTSGTESVV